METLQLVNVKSLEGKCIACSVESSTGFQFEDSFVVDIVECQDSEVNLVSIGTYVITMPSANAMELLENGTTRWRGTHDGPDLMYMATIIK